MTRPDHQQNLEDEDDDDVNDPADSENVSPRVVGHNIYILIHQVTSLSIRRML